MKSIYIYGASGHGLVIFDIAKAYGYEKIIFVDDGDNEHHSFADIKDKSDIPMAFGIGDNHVRAKLFEKVESSGFEVVTLIHPSAVVSQSAEILKGTVVMPYVVVNAKAKVGQGVILNSSCVVEHECIIGDFTHISPNAALAGDVKIGNFTHIGIGANVLQCITIGRNCIVGGGSMVIDDIENNLVVADVPTHLVEGGVNNSLYVPQCRCAS